MKRMSIIRNRIMKGCCQLFFFKNFFGTCIYGRKLLRWVIALLAMVAPIDEDSTLNVANAD